MQCAPQPFGTADRFPSRAEGIAGYAFPAQPAWHSRMGFVPETMKTKARRAEAK